MPFFFFPPFFSVNPIIKEFWVIIRAGTEYKNTKKVGTLIGDEEDVERRKRLSNAALTKLLNVWIKGDKIKRKTKLKLYRSLVKSILVYNCGTWALTKSEEEKLNAFHRKQLRKVLNIKYPVKITNSSLYNKCEEHPLSIYILENRWRLFGHILRRNIEIPANKSMNSYFATHGKKFRGRPLTTLPVVLNKDLSRLQENTLQLTTREDLEHLRCIAQNRQQWRELSTRIRKAAEAPPSDDWDAEGPKSSKSIIKRVSLHLALCRRSQRRNILISKSWVEKQIKLNTIGS